MAGIERRAALVMIAIAHPNLLAQNVEVFTNIPDANGSERLAIACELRMCWCSLLALLCPHLQIDVGNLGACVTELAVLPNWRHAIFVMPCSDDAVRDGAAIGRAFNPVGGAPGVTSVRVEWRLLGVRSWVVTVERDGGHVVGIGVLPWRHGRRASEPVDLQVWHCVLV